MHVLEAERIARGLHEGQVDLAGQEYCGHLERVANGVMSVTSFLMFEKDERVVGLLEQMDWMQLLNECKVVAWLHDSVEDTDVTIEYLANAGLNEDELLAVDCLTKRKGESRECYLNRVMSNTRATIVKISDLKDNMNLNRLPKITNKDVARQDKYQKNLAKLMNLPEEHGPEIYSRMEGW